jgi:hypothetical protein
MALALAVGLTLTYGGRLLPVVRSLGVGGLFAGLFIGLSNPTFIGAITNTTSPIPWSSWLRHLSIALFARLLIGERVTLRTWIVIAVALAGMVVIFASALGGGSLFGDLPALLTAAIFSLGVVILRRA